MLKPSRERTLDPLVRARSRTGTTSRTPTCARTFTHTILMHSRGRGRLHEHLRACHACDACSRANPAHVHPPHTGAARKLRWSKRGGGSKQTRGVCVFCGEASLGAAGAHAGAPTTRGGGRKGKHQDKGCAACGDATVGVGPHGATWTLPGLRYPPHHPPMVVGQRGAAWWAHSRSDVHMCGLPIEYDGQQLCACCLPAVRRAKSMFRHKKIKSPSELHLYGLCAAWLGGGADFTF